MTLIIANKEGMHAEDRALDSHGTPSHGQKMYPWARRMSFWLGFSGAIPTDKIELGILGQVYSIASLAIHLVEQKQHHTSFTGDGAFMRAAAGSAQLYLAGCMYDFDSPSVMVVTKYHNIDIGKKNDSDHVISAYESFLPPDAFLAMGSSERVARLLNLNGATIEEIYTKAAWLDNGVNSTYYTSERSSLCDIALPFAQRIAFEHAINFVGKLKVFELFRADLLKSSYFLWVFARELSKRQRKRKEGGWYDFTPFNIKTSFIKADAYVTNVFKLPEEEREAIWKAEIAEDKKD